MEDERVAVGVRGVKSFGPTQKLKTEYGKLSIFYFENSVITSEDMSFLSLSSHTITLTLGTARSSQRRAPSANNAKLTGGGHHDMKTVVSVTMCTENMKASEWLRSKNCSETCV